MLSARIVAVIAGSVCVAASAQAGGLNVTATDVIYTKIATNPNSIVPGALDLAGQPAVTNFRALEDLIMSPDGTRWVIKGRTQQGSDLETCLLMGSGLSGTMFVQEGQPIIGGVPGELYDFFGSGLGAGRFDNANNFAFAARARGGSAAIFQKVIKWTGGANFTIPFAMGSLITGLVDTTVSGDETFGNSVGSIHLLDNGTIGSQDSSIGNINSLRRPAIMYNQAAFHQTNITTITNLAGSGIEVWKTISANTFYTTPDGAHWIANGQVNQPTTNDEVLVVDGRVVMQEGILIPGTGVTMTAVFNNDIKSNGDWYARGDDPADNDWAVRNGVLIAKTGDAISGTENWGAVFSAFNINRNGDWVLAGNTDSANPAANEVVVVNGTVVLREGDPVDLDGNAQFDDDAFVGRGNNTLSAFEPNDFVLTDDLHLYCFLSLRNGAGQDLNSTPAFGSPQAFIRLTLATPPLCLTDLDNSGVTDTADLVIFLANFATTVPPNTNGDNDGDGDVDTADLVNFLGAFGLPCP